MPRVTEIHCPYHGAMEKLEFPDSYFENGFEGEVTCAPPEGERRLPLRIKIERGSLVKMERAITRS